MDLFVEPHLNMTNTSSSYRSIVKSTAVFGGAQIVQMIITILRAKFIAVFLGSQGMGINAIFQSTIAVISSFSSFGIFQSAVRDISQAHESGDKHRLSKTNTVLARIVWLTGGFGMLVCLIGSHWLSKFSFGNSDYTWHFALLSVTLLFMALANGKMVLLQGTRNLTYLAKASMLGAMLSLTIGVPLYYFLGVMGIILSIITSSLLLYLTQFHYTKKIKLDKIVKLSLALTIAEGKPMVKLGSVMMLGTVTITIFTYLTNIFIGRYGKIEDVGLFQGVSSITMQSIAVVIAVLASDLFPRLSAVYQDKNKVDAMVNQQLELVSLINAPIIVALIVFAPQIIGILLSNEFLIVVPMLRWMALSLLFRGIWLTMSYIILANGDKKAYFIYDALIGNGLLFLINIIAYTGWGIQGLGISFLVGTIATTGLLFLVVRVKYGFCLNVEFSKIFGVLISLVASSYLVMNYLEGWFQYGFSIVITILTFIYSFYILNNRIGILQILRLKFLNSSNIN